MNYYKIGTFLLLSIITHTGVYHAAKKTADYQYASIIKEKDAEINDIQNDFMTMVKQRDMVQESCKMNESTIEGYKTLVHDMEVRYKNEIELLETELSQSREIARAIQNQTFIKIQDATDKMQEEYNKSFMRKCCEKAVEAVAITTCINGISKLGSLTYSYLS